MIRPTKPVGLQSSIWLLPVRRLQRCFRLRHLLLMLIALILLTYLRLINHAPSDASALSDGQEVKRDLTNYFEQYRSVKCNFDQIESLLRHSLPKAAINDTRPQPSVQRLHKLFQVLISHEDKFHKVFDTLGVFRFTSIYNTLRPYANNTERLHDVYCAFQRYITISDNGHMDISPTFVQYLAHMSSYLADGVRQQHSTWTETAVQHVPKPVIILAANNAFYNMLQASMRTVNEHLKDHRVVIYDLGFTKLQQNMILENCDRCTLIQFPFAQVESVASHIRALGNFAWKPIVIQDAVRRYGSIIYGDTSVRYKTSNLSRLLIDNAIRGFSCRELPGHYLPCFTSSKTFSWFNESNVAFDDVYIAEAGFVAVTDNFLSRLILKTWVTCALDANCISPPDSKAECTRRAKAVSIHRFDQSAMVAILSFYFFPSARQNGVSQPAPYDMYSSIQAQIAEVRRAEGDPNYFTTRKSSQRQ